MAHHPLIPSVRGGGKSPKSVGVAGHHSTSRNFQDKKIILWWSVSFTSGFKFFVVNRVLVGFFLSQVSNPHTQAWVKYLPSDIALEKVGDEFLLSSDCHPNRITSLLSKPAIRRSLSFAVRVREGKNNQRLFVLLSCSRLSVIDKAGGREKNERGQREGKGRALSP